MIPLKDAIVKNASQRRVVGQGNSLYVTPPAPRYREDSAGKALYSPPAKLINVQIKKDVRALKKHLLTKVKK